MESTKKSEDDHHFFFSETVRQCYFNPSLQIQVFLLFTSPLQPSRISADVFAIQEHLLV